MKNLNESIGRNHLYEKPVTRPLGATTANQANNCIRLALEMAALGDALGAGIVVHGSEIWLRLTAAPIRLEDGEQLGGILIVQDIDTGKREREHFLELAGELTLSGFATTCTSHDKAA